MLYCRLTPSEKLPDRFLFSGVLKNPDNTVYLSYIIEVTKPWFPTSRVATVIINELKGNLGSLSGAVDSLKNFEETLKNVNESLFNLSEQGEIEWIGNLNSLIMLVKDNEIHLAQTGSLPGYLFRKQKINQITEGLSMDRESHPLKTFSSIISGQIETNDKILLANHELFNVLSLDMLRQIIANNSPYQASLSILRSLKKHNVPAVSSLVLDFSVKSETEPEPESIIIEEGFERWHKKAWRLIYPKLAQGATNFKLGSIRAYHFYKEKISPKMSSAAKIGLAGVQKGTKSAANYTKDKIIPGVRGHVEKIVLKRTPEQEKNRVEKLKDENTFVKTSFFSKNFTKSLRVVNRVGFSTKKIFYVFVAFILIATTFLIVKNRQQKTDNSITRADSAVVIKQVKASIASATKLSQSDQKDQSIAEYRNALALVAKIDSKMVEKKSFTDQIAASLDQLTLTTRLTDSVGKLTFSDETINQLEIATPYIYASSLKVGKVYRQAPGALESAKETEIKPNSAISKGVVDLFFTSTSGSQYKMIVTSGDGQAFNLIQEGTDSTLTQIEFPLGKFAASDAAEGYLNNLYLLDSSTGLLWKYPASDSSYGKGTNQVNIDEIDLKNSVSLAIDGYIYVLKDDGTVIKLLKGIREANFNLQTLPGNDKIAKPLKIMTGQNDNNLYILDGGVKNHQNARVIEYDKNGAFVKQYALPNKLDQVKDAVIKPSEKKLWLLSASTIYEFDLP